MDPRRYHVSIDELVADARVDPDRQEQAQPELSTNGLADEFQEQLVRSLWWAGG